MPMTRIPAVSSGRSLNRAASRMSSADALVVEEELDGDEPAEQVADLDGDDRDRRRQRVPQHVLADDDGGREPLEVRRSRVVGVERLDHAGARDAGDVPEQDDAERHRGQQQVLDLRQRARALVRHCAVTGSQPSQIAKTRIRTIPETKSGHRGQRDPRDRDRFVGQPCRSGARRSRRRGSRAARRSGTRGSRASAELTSAGPSRSHAGTWRAATSRGRRARARRPSRGTGVRSGRFVPSCSLSASTDSWVANGPSTARPTLPGQDVGHREHDHAEQEQRDQRETEALEDEADHRRPIRRRAGGGVGSPARRYRTGSGEARPSPAGSCEIPSGT